MTLLLVMKPKRNLKKQIEAIISLNESLEQLSLDMEKLMERFGSSEDGLEMRGALSTKPQHDLPENPELKREICLKSLT